MIKIELNKLVIVSLFVLAILTMGAVSAADGNATLDELMIDEDLDLKSSLDVSDEILSNESGDTFSDLSGLIENAAEGDVLELDTDYYNDGSVSSDGISISKSITVDGKGHKLDAQGTSRIFTIEADEVTLKNIVFENGYHNSGGAIYWNAGNGSIVDCSFVNCSANDGDGGAIYWGGNDGSVVGCSFVNCSANDGGGAIYLWAWGCIDFSVSNCNFVNCYANDGYGGAIEWGGNDGSVVGCSFVNCSLANVNNVAVHYWSKNFNLINSSFFNCVWYGEEEGNIRNVSVDDVEYDIDIFNNLKNNSRIVLTKDYQIGTSILINVNNLVIDGNGNSIVGGGNSLFVINGSNITFKNVIFKNGRLFFNSINATVVGCSFVNCSRAIYWQDSVNGSVVDCSFVDCSSENYGGAIYIENYSKNVDIVDCSFVNCSAYEGGAIYCNNDNCSVINCNFVNCSAGDCGSAIWSGGNGSVIGCTMENCYCSNDDYYDNAIYFGAYEYYDFELEEWVSIIDCNHVLSNSYFVNCNWFSENNITVINITITNTTSDTNSTGSKVDPVIKASNISVVYSAGSYYTITVYGTDGKLANGANVKITGKISKSLTTTNGIAKFKVTQVPGTYKITITAMGKSVAKTITVKHLVTLKTVKVKKSAKKLILQATLGKVNGKYLKNKKITFKFNGKKYPAKTNKKGIAKVTIKSKVLKKLKVGKKVTYQATYLKDTVKKSTKIKK